MNYLYFGSVVANDEIGTIDAGTFSPGDDLFIELRYNLDAGTYGFYFNRVLRFSARPNGVVANGRGIGKITARSSSVTMGHWVIDDLYVYQPDVLFKDGFDGGFF